VKLDLPAPSGVTDGAVAREGLPEEGNEMIDRVINSRGFDNFDFRFIGLIFVILGSAFCRFIA